MSLVIKKMLQNILMSKAIGAIAKQIGKKEDSHLRSDINNFRESQVRSIWFVLLAFLLLVFLSIYFHYDLKKNFNNRLDKLEEILKNKSK